MLESRHGDLREQNLNRQGKGHFHVSGMGHEALAAISIQMEPDDYIVPVLSRSRAGARPRRRVRASWRSIIWQSAKRQSHGRQMPSHYSYAELHIWSVPTPNRLATSPGLRDGLGHQARWQNAMSSSPPSAMPRRARAIFSRRSVSRRRRNCPCCSSSKTTPTASAVRRARSIRSRSMFCSLTIGARLDGADVGQVLRGRRGSHRAHARRQRTGVFLGR